MGSNADTLATYQAHFDRYIEKTPKELSLSQEQWLLKTLSNLPHDACILEIGSAFGRDAAFMAGQGYTNIEVTDAFDAAVSYLNDCGFAAKKLNILDDEPDGEYDAIIASAVFLHFTEQELHKILAKCHRHLGEAGIVAFSLKVGYGEEWTDAKMDAPRFFRYWQPVQVREMLVQVGFNVLDEQIAEMSGQVWVLYIASRQ